MKHFPLGLWMIAAMFVLGGVHRLYVGGEGEQALQLWWPHPTTYDDAVERLASWNAHNEIQGEITLLSRSAMTRRLLSGLYADTPLADVVDLDFGIAPSFFRGPVDDIGFYELSELIERDGLDETFHPAAFNLVSFRGGIYGLPKHVLTSVLCYRADLIEEAGIDVSEIETWEQWIDALAPLVKDLDGDGHIDRYAMQFAMSRGGDYENLFLQASGRLYHESGRPYLRNATNARVLAMSGIWSHPSRPVVTDVELLSQTGYKLLLDGYYLSFVAAQYQAHMLARNIPALHGKLKFMLLPAWEPGGGRTTPIAGAFLSITKPHGGSFALGDLETRWRFVKHQQATAEAALKTWNQAQMLPANRTVWNHPDVQQPYPFFGGQRIGEIFIASTENLPRLPSSPYHNVMRSELTKLGLGMLAFVKSYPEPDYEAFYAKALVLLEEAEERINEVIDRNVYYDPDEEAGES